jgi:uncharacterized protein
VIYSKVEAQVRQWLEKSVIGLNLCPFAKSPYVKKLVRVVVSDTDSEPDLERLVQIEMQRLVATDRRTLETTLIIHPQVLKNFYDYHFFIGELDRQLTQSEFSGVIQIASFHPNYQFANTSADDASNNTNRSPYPLIHLLREVSIDEAVASKLGADEIVERNITTMTSLGNDGYTRLFLAN